MNNTAARFVLHTLFSSKKTYLLLVGYFLLYQFLATLIQGFSLFSSFYQTMLPVFTKIEVTPYIFESALRGTAHTTLTLQTIIAILFALNMTLITTKMSTQTNRTVKIGLTAGIISLITAGCSACGISLIAFLGAGTALATLPFRGTEILTLTILVLTTTLLYNFRAFTLSCKIR